MTFKPTIRKRRDRFFMTPRRTGRVLKLSRKRDLNFDLEVKWKMPHRTGSETIKHDMNWGYLTKENAILLTKGFFRMVQGRDSMITVIYMPSIKREKRYPTNKTKFDLMVG